MKILFSALTALAIVVGSTAAFADSGDGPQFDLPQPVPATGPATTVVTAAPLTNDVGSEIQLSFNGQPATISQDDAALLAADGNEGIVQTANSAPIGFTNGTLATMTAVAAGNVPPRLVAQR